jgi:large subunit ribosomal protein L19
MGAGYETEKRGEAIEYVDFFVRSLNILHLSIWLNWTLLLEMHETAVLTTCTRQTIRRTRLHTLSPNPVATVTASQTTLLDPTGARTRLFAKDNPECARVGDILLVRQRTGDPFAGVCINIRRRGVDTAILLRGQLTRVGVEMWYKVYSPLVEGIEVVQRAAKRARRARLTYMRLVKHDRGSVENVVRMYLRQKAALGTAEGQKKKGAGAAAAMMGGKKKGRGKKR